MDDLELELRKLPGVRAAGFSERDDMLLVQVQVSGDQPPATLPQQAARIAYRHADKPVALEIVRWRTVEVPAAPPGPAVETIAPAPNTEPPVPVIAPAGDTATDPGTRTDDSTADDGSRARIRLLAVLTFPDTDELEVHLTFGVGASSAARRRVPGSPAPRRRPSKACAPSPAGSTTAVDWANELADQDTDGVYVIAVSIHAGDATRLGIAAGGSRIEAAARATLHAVNRALEEQLGTDESA